MIARLPLGVLQLLLLVAALGLLAAALVVGGWNGLTLLALLTFLLLIATTQKASA